MKVYKLKSLFYFIVLVTSASFYNDIDYDETKNLETTVLLQMEKQNLPNQRHRKTHSKTQ